MDRIYPKVRISRAVTHYGSKAELGRQLGITGEAIIGWLKAGMTYFPEVRAWQIAGIAPELVEQPPRVAKATAKRAAKAAA